MNMAGHNRDNERGKCEADGPALAGSDKEHEHRNQDVHTALNAIIVST